MIFAVKTIEIARRMAQLGEKEEALRAYTLVVGGDAAPDELLEAAAYILQNGGDYKIAYSAFVGLYNAGYRRADILALMREAFYEPNVKLLKGRYERNRKLLAKYPYLFRKDFPTFDELPLLFFPYDDNNGYVPFDTKEQAFRPFVNVREPVVTRNFFRDLEKPILASDVYSQYELEYLNDNVRPSEWVGRENHIYLHYTDWAEFCAHLAVLSVKPLVESQKAVFLIGDERSRYPIDFKAEFGVDYGKYPVRPVGIREIHKIIFHTQFSAHNGGDFFNEIFDNHPNLLCKPSVDFEQAIETFQKNRVLFEQYRSEDEAVRCCAHWGRPEVVRELYRLKNRTDKDFLVADYLHDTTVAGALDPASRIAPAIFYQPHFRRPWFTVAASAEAPDAVEFSSNMWEAIRESQIFRDFRYIKTFSPMRRPTTSYAATVRYGVAWLGEERREEDGRLLVIAPFIPLTADNRSFLRDPDERIYHDAVVVRFEDGKLNPKATFTRLAEFLDIPYTESMTYCSKDGVHDVQTMPGNAVGFDPAPVYRTYDDYADDGARRYIEWCLRDAYAYYGYDFHYYGGADAAMDDVRDWLTHTPKFDALMRNYFSRRIKDEAESAVADAGGTLTDDGEALMDDIDKEVFRLYKEPLLQTAALLLSAPRYINHRGQPLQMTPLLQPDPALLEQPLYR